MSGIILHHYPASHVSEKIRITLAYKQLTWHSVEQPIMMPKPFLTPLTGGYRRIPVMQVGADVYCDSACVIRRLEQLHPSPPIIFPELESLATVIEDWADHRFMWQALKPGFVEFSEYLPPGIMDDRAKMAPELTKENFFRDAPHALSQALQSLRLLDGMLAGKLFLLGDKFSLADAACYYIVYFMSNSPKVFEPTMVRFPALHAWFERIRAFGPSMPHEMTPQQALDVARRSEPADLQGGIGDIEGVALAESFRIGERIGVLPDDYGQEQVCGTLARVTPDEIAVLREDPDLGRIAVHFPRIGYRLTRL